MTRMGEGCDGNWRSCGHCKVRFDGPSFDPARPFCDKAGFWDMLLGNDWCPYAPLTDSDEVQKEENNAD